MTTNWLTSEVWYALLPLLRAWAWAWAWEHWSFSTAAGRVVVSLDAPLYLFMQRGVEPRFGPVYNISLVEKAADGTLRLERRAQGVELNPVLAGAASKLHLAMIC